VNFPKFAFGEKVSVHSINTQNSKAATFYEGLEGYVYACQSTGDSYAYRVYPTKVPIGNNYHSIPSGVGELELFALIAETMPWIDEHILSHI
jgi:hypothetical protein